jgi:hypothetical protein
MVGGTITVSSTSALVTFPPKLLTSTLYFPASLAVTPMKIKLELVPLATSTPPRFHW